MLLNKAPYKPVSESSEEQVTGLGYVAPDEMYPAPFLSLEPTYPDFKPKNGTNYTQLMYPFLIDLMDEK